MTQKEEIDFLTEVDKTLDFAAGEVLLVDKPLRWTSFDVVNKIRRSLKPLKVKVGHAGTLDPLATGLLVICTGRFTKKIDQYQAEAKEYTGEITLGATTPSYDLETAIDATFAYQHLTEEQIRSAAETFVGEIAQRPPVHSAIKQQGERVYEKARRGEVVTMEPRWVTIHEMEIIDVDLPRVSFRVRCSKGTYIRSLAHDLGQKLACGGHLSALRRTRSGDFHVDSAWQVPDLVARLREWSSSLSNDDDRAADADSKRKN